MWHASTAKARSLSVELQPEEAIRRDSPESPAEAIHIAGDADSAARGKGSTRSGFFRRKPAGGAVTGERGGRAVEEGAALPSTVTGSMSSVLVPSGS